MRSLISFFVKHNFTFGFLGFQIVCFLLIIQFNNFHRANFFTTVQNITGESFRTVGSIKSYFSLKEINEVLAIENAALRAQLANYKDPVMADLLFTMASPTVSYEFTAAKVVNSSRFKLKNHITINKGYKDGIEHQSGVINQNGIVGFVKDVGPNYSTLISVLHTDAAYSVALKKNNYFGILRWDGKKIDESILYDIPNHVAVEIGDTVISRGGNSIFPEGIMIGTIHSIVTKEGDAFYELVVKLAADFSNLNYVYVAKAMAKAERDSLENSFDYGE